MKDPYCVHRPSFPVPTDNSDSPPEFRCSASKCTPSHGGPGKCPLWGSGPHQDNLQSWRNLRALENLQTAHELLPPHLLTLQKAADNFEEAVHLRWTLGQQPMTQFKLGGAGGDGGNECHTLQDFILFLPFCFCCLVLFRHIVLLLRQGLLKTLSKSRSSCLSPLSAGFFFFFFFFFSSGD
jgi:hypothetical protein